MRLFGSLCQVGRTARVPASFSTIRTLKDNLNKYATYHPTTLTLESMLKFGEF